MRSLAIVLLFVSAIATGLVLGAILAMDASFPLRPGVSGWISATPLAIVLAYVAFRAIQAWLPEVTRVAALGAYAFMVATSLTVVLALGRTWIVGRQFERCIEGRSTGCASLSSLVSRQSAPNTKQLRAALYCRECFLAPGSDFCARILSNHNCEVATPHLP